MKKRVIATLLAAAMAATLFTGCGGSSSGSSSSSTSASTEASGEGLPYEGVTLSLWMSQSEYNEGTKAILEKATATLGMQFEVEINPGGTEGDNIIKTKCASGDLPDIVNYNSGSLFTALNPSQHFYDLTDEAMTASFDEAFCTTVSQDGRVYGAPYTTTQAGAVVYWKPDYEELGLEVPKTWDEFLANCEALKAAGKSAIYMSAGSTWTTQVLFLGDNYNLIAAEPDFAENFTAGTAKFASSETGVAGWSKYEGLIDYYQEGYTAATYDDGLEDMAVGTATHWFILTQVIPMMIAAHPEAEENLGVFAIPGDDADNCGITVWEPNTWAISKDSANIDASLAFLEFWYEKENMDLFIESFGANGPSCIKGYTLPDSVAPAIRVDMQAYFDEGKTCPALEFLTTVKGSTCEQITTSAALGQITGAEAAALYDDDCKKSAVQQGLGWE